MVSNTSVTQARKGKDLQPIPWDRLSITEEETQITRLKQYSNYGNVTLFGEPRIRFNTS